jgi:tetratricopeptide (TPR) repeat protein
MIGFANAKLGRLEQARNWFQRALAADPNHLSTLFSSGALYLMRGDTDKARGELARIKSVCGAASCPEYQQLEQLIAAKTR